MLSCGNGVGFDLDYTLSKKDTKEFFEYARKWSLNTFQNALLKKIPEYKKKPIRVIYDDFMEKVVKPTGSNFPKHYNMYLRNLKLNHRKNKDVIQATVDAYHFFRDTEFPGYIAPGAKKALQNLQDRGCYLFVVTDGIREKQIAKLEMLDISDFFEFVVVSEDVKKQKPHRRIFKEAHKQLKRIDLDMNPSDITYVGDNPYRDIYGASRMNWNTILIKGGPHSSQSFHGARPTHIIDNLEQLVESNLLEYQPSIETGPSIIPL